MANEPPGRGWPFVIAEPEGSPPVDLLLQQYVRTTAAEGRETERIGPFLATLDPHTDHPYLNYAIPDDGARFTVADVAALVDAFERRSRVPRLEYLPAAAPAAADVLFAAGLAIEAELPLMTCAPEDLIDLGAPPGIELAPPETDDDLLGMSSAQMAAFG